MDVRGGPAPNSSWPKKTSRRGSARELVKGLRVHIPSKTPGAPAPPAPSCIQSHAPPNAMVPAPRAADIMAPRAADMRAPRAADMRAPRAADMASVPRSTGVLTIDTSNKNKCGYPNCHYESSRTSNVKKHRLIHSSECPHKCTVEGCTFATRETGNLKRHLQTHRDERPHKCPDCDFRATQYAHIKRHLKSHKSESFACPVGGCEYTTKHEGIYARHARTHNKRIPCQHHGCSFIASNAKNLREHNKSHEVKPFVCSFAQCTFASTSNGQLLSHHRAHVAEHAELELDERFHNTSPGPAPSGTPSAFLGNAGQVVCHLSPLPTFDISPTFAVHPFMSPRVAPEYLTPSPGRASLMSFPRVSPLLRPSLDEGDNPWMT